MVLVTRKPIIEVLFDNFINQEWRISIFNKTGFNVFYIIMKRVQLLQILNYLSIKHLIKLSLYENDVKLLKFKRSPV